MKRYVIDASVVLVGILESRKGLVEKTRSLFLMAKEDGCELISSQFLKIEVSNGIRFNERDVDKANRLLNGFFNLPINFVSLSKSLYEQSLSSSYKLGTTVYDTSYHILAKAQGATFLTCDEEYYKKAKSIGDIELLG